MKEILVNVLVITYNHEKYIRKAIESILSQKTNFRFNIIIGEDFSSDSTRAILLDMKEKNPDKIELILHDQNIGAKKNLKKVEEYCDAPYIAILEGDDYWTDKEKLQKQIDFLEANLNYSACVHSIKVVDSSEKEILNTYHEKIYYDESEYDKNILNLGILPGQSGTMVYRNFLKDMESFKIDSYYSTNANGDWRRTVLLLSKGPIFCFPEKMSNYRYVISEGSSWNARSYGKNLNDQAFDSFNDLEKFAKELSLEGIDFIIAKQNVGYGALKFMFKAPSKENFIKFNYIYRKIDRKGIFWINLFKRVFQKK